MELITAYFKNGLLTKISPSPNYSQYSVRYIITDGERFDLENASDIKNIPVPDFKPIHMFSDISKSLDYVLKRKAGDLSNKGLFELSILCLQKSNQLMSYSPISWNKSDYFYIVLELARADKFEDAKREKRFIEEHYFDKYDYQTLHNKCLKIALQNARELGTDLVEADNPPNCDALCAKYRKRIYSLNGKDGRFPIMTDTIFKSGLMFYPFIYGISQPRYCRNDELISYSNRPFVDDRTDDEKENYIKYKRQQILDNRKAEDFIEYRQICKIVPFCKPRSFKHYQEMKLDLTNNFDKLMETAKEFGIDIEL